jgi:hypothetical protein
MVYHHLICTEEIKENIILYMIAHILCVICFASHYLSENEKINNHYDHFRKNSYNMAYYYNNLNYFFTFAKMV